MSALRRWVEDRLPWYDRDAEHAAHLRTEEIRKKSIETRIRAEAIRAQQRIVR